MSRKKVHHEAGRAEQSGPVTEAQHVVAAYWAAAEARDWQAFGGLVADDIVYEGPQTRERVRGREAYVRFNARTIQATQRLTTTGADLRQRQQEVVDLRRLCRPRVAGR